MNPFNYKNLTLSELINKIDTARFFNLPKMVAEALRKLVSQNIQDAPQDGEQYARQDGDWTVVEASAGIESISGDFVDNTDPLNPVLEDPRPYKVYTAFLNQTGTNAPVATVLENTLGHNVVWTRNAVGVYTGTLPIGSNLAGKKLFASISPYSSSSLDVPIFRISSNTETVSIQSFSVEPIRYDGILEDNAIEIRMYN